ncbi:MAG TPA: nuclear transport factor 2 family protein, partial [Blastocatellia bacterium]|nr:nuclear transport factor 2 family protein [Blastocatellia bacterium]
MTRFLVFTFLAVVMPLLAFGQATNKKSSGNAEDEIMKIEDQWVQSRATKDPTMSKDLLADDYLGANTTGQPLTKQQFIDAVTAGALFAGKAEQTDRKVRIYGDTAVSTGVVTGVAGADKVRYLRVFVKRNNKW